VTPNRRASLVRERKMATLFHSSLRDRELGKPSVDLEASDVIVAKGSLYVVFDNLPRVGRIRTDLRPGSARWVGSTCKESGFEAITFDPQKRRFYAVVEAARSSFGSFQAKVVEFDDSLRHPRPFWVDYAFEKRNKGFEGVTHARRRKEFFLLALCEGNRCCGGKRGKQSGHGRIKVLRKTGGEEWCVEESLELPATADFEDYSGLDLDGERLVVVSQSSRRLWTGRLTLDGWKFADRGTVYKMPSRDYCNVEGASWLDRDHVVVVSDRKKASDPEVCEGEDQSIHVLRLE
jgi:hypothetical protein